MKDAILRTNLTFLRMTALAATALTLVAFGVSLPGAAPGRAELGDFEGYDIRVIRPRFMAKEPWS